MMQAEPGKCLDVNEIIMISKLACAKSVIDAFVQDSHRIRYAYVDSQATQVSEVRAAAEISCLVQTYLADHRSSSEAGSRRMRQERACQHARVEPTNFWHLHRKKG